MNPDYGITIYYRLLMQSCADARIASHHYYCECNTKDFDVSSIDHHRYHHYRSFMQKQTLGDSNSILLSLIKEYIRALAYPVSTFASSRDDAGNA
jgi:hypothetical protein